MVFHILGSSIASLNEIEDTAPFTTDAKYFLVKNFINNTSFFDWDQATQTSYFKKLKDAVTINIPKLNEMAYEQVELASVPFLTFVANKNPKGEGANYPSCCVAMFATGSAMSGRNTTASNCSTFSTPRPASLRRRGLPSRAAPPGRNSLQIT